MNLTATIAASLTINQIGMAVLSSQQSLVNNINRTLSLVFINGTGSANMIDQIYAKAGNFVASTAFSVQPSSSGSLKDSFNASVAMARLRVVYFANLATVETNNAVTIGAGTFPVTAIFPSTSTIIVPAGGVFLAAAPGATGYALAAGSADTLTFTPSTGTPAYELILLGASS